MLFVLSAIHTLDNVPVQPLSPVVIVAIVLVGGLFMVVSFTSFFNKD